MIINEYNKKGVYHKEAKKENQDYLFSIDEDEFIAIMLADGATGCKYGLEGAKLACESMTQIIKTEGQKFFNYPKDKIAYLSIEHILYLIENNMLAKADINEYGSTFSLALMEKKTGQTILLSLGDGAIMKINDSGTTYLLKPKRYRGNPCLTTTMGAHKAMEITLCQLSLGDSILMCSDGFLHQLNNENNELAHLLNSYNLEELNNKLTSSINQDDCSYITFTRKRI